MKPNFHLLCLDLIKDSILNYLQSCVVCLYFPSISFFKLYPKMQRRYSSFRENLKTQPLPPPVFSLSISVLPPLSLTDSHIVLLSLSFLLSLLLFNSFLPSFVFFLFHSLFSIPLSFSLSSLLSLSKFPK